jgi:hypothetical protein
VSPHCELDAIKKSPAIGSIKDRRLPARELFSIYALSLSAGTGPSGTSRRLFVHRILFSSCLIGS